MRVIFMGTPEYAEQILKRLIDEPSIDVVAVYSQPDKPVGRKQLLTPPPVKQLAEQHHIAVHQPHRLRDEATVSELLQIPCDAIVVAAYGQILPKAVLDHAPCINLHASILPAYRGASPIQQALLHGDTESGVTAMLMNEGLDTGDILKIAALAIGPDERAPELYTRLTDEAANLTVDVLSTLATLRPIAQDDDKATHCTKITKDQGQIAWEDASEIYNRFRAFTPWPGIYLENGLKLLDIRLETPTGVHRGGEILEVGKHDVLIGCRNGSLRVMQVQPPSKKAMAVTDYLRGQRLGVADTLA